MKEEKPLVMDNAFFILSLILIGLSAIIGVLLIPFAVLGVLIWVWVKSAKNNNFQKS